MIIITTNKTQKLTTMKNIKLKISRFLKQIKENKIKFETIIILHTFAIKVYISSYYYGLLHYKAITIEIEHKTILIICLSSITKT